MTRKLKFVPALREALDEELARDESVFLMGEDVGVGIFGVTTGLVEKYGVGRVRNTPISEAAIVGAGLGAALAGARPIVELQFGSLAYLAMDQLVNQAAKARYMSGGQVKVPLTVRAAVTMGFGSGAQHSDTPHALLAHCPGLKLVLPGSPRDAKGLMKTAIRSDDLVVVLECLQLSRAPSEEIPDDELIPLGVARVVRPGTDLTIVALGSGVPLAVDAAETLARDDVSVEVIDPRTIVPMDWETILTSAEKTGRVVVVDDAPPFCSVASEIAATVSERAFSQLRAPVRRVTRSNVPVPFSAPLEAFVMVDVTKIEEAARSLLGVKAPR
jgi:pyruvate/2-oxoglutarate/acetoin dehydrogenase E1 component